MYFTHIQNSSLNQGSISFAFYKGNLVGDKFKPYKYLFSITFYETERAFNNNIYYCIYTILEKLKKIKELNFLVHWFNTPKNDHKYFANLLKENKINICECIYLNKTQENVFSILNDYGLKKSLRMKYSILIS